MYLFLQIQSGISTNMYLFWRLIHSLDILKATRWVTFAPYFLATVLVSFAALVAIGTIATVAKIAFNEQSWMAFIVLLVTIVQVGNIKIIIRKKLLLALRKIKIIKKKNTFSLGETCTWPGFTCQVD